VAEHRRNNEPVHGPDRHEVRTAEHSREPDEGREDAQSSASVVEDANGDAEIEVPVIKSEEHLVWCRRQYGEDADALASTIRGGGCLFERGGRGDEPKRPNNRVP